MTFANTQENRKNFPLFLARSDICNWKYFLSSAARESMSNFEAGKQLQQRRSAQKSQHKFLGLQAKFCSSPSTSISSHPQKSLLLQHSFTKSGGTIKNETTWYHPNSVWYGFYFSSNVLGMFSTNITREWKNNLNCSITKENRAELVSISIPIDANRLAAVMSILEEARNEI